MDVTFHGAVREVTGSMHLITTGTDRILLDCGMFQGRRKESNEKNMTLPIDPETISNLVLSHAHIDHSGRIPMLAKNNFYGHIVCTRATADASEYLLLDSAHIQESDAEYLNYKTVRSFLSQLKTGEKRELADIKKLLKKDRYKLNTETINEMIQKYGLDSVFPLYTTQDAEQALGFFEGYPYRHRINIGKDVTCKFYEAGHILGSAFSIIKAKENGKSLTVCYTGDIGRFDKPILRDPCLNFEEEDRDIDLMIMESTYGNRVHEASQDLGTELKKVILDTLDRNGSVLIPAFAYGRTQELVYILHELYDKGEVPRVPIYVDSPLAIKLTKVFGEHPEVYDRETHETFLKKGKNPFSFGQIHFVSAVEESMALMQEEKPHIVIASSGMCEAGRILHHLRYKIHNPKNTILIVGFMAENTLGRRILEQGITYQESGRSGSPPLLKFLNKVYPLKAKVAKIGGFSAHGDKNEMLRFLKTSNLNIKKIAVVHGEEDQSLSFAEFLKNEGFSATVPQPGETIHVG